MVSRATVSSRRRLSVSHGGRFAAAHARSPVAPVAAVAAVAQQVAHMVQVCQPACLAMEGTTGRPAAVAAALLAAGACLAACGDEGTFTAESFVAEVNAQGVELRLGEALVTEEEDKELYAIELEPVGRPGTDSQGDEPHAGGSLSVYESDEGDPDDELRTCEEAADLLCYRAANVVVVLEGGGIESQQLGMAMQGLSE